MKKILLTLFSFGLAINVSFSQTPIASYSLNSNAVDKSVNHFDGTLVGNVKPTTNKDGKFGCALSFDKQSYLTIKYNPLFKIENDSIMAISFWIKFNSLSGNDTILKRGKTGAILRRIDAGLALNLNTTFSNLIPDTNWHFIEIVGHGSPACSLYVDKEDNQQYLLELPLFDALDDIYIGNFDGKLDDLKFFSYVGSYDLYRDDIAPWHPFVSSSLESCKFTYNKEDDDLFLSPQVLTENNIYNFNVNDYTRGRDISTSCKTSKADSNTVDLFVKFTASATNETIIINADNTNYETLVELTTAPYTCNAAFQIGQNQRFYTFSGLTIGTEYTARVEFGGDAPIGFARLNAANNASIVLKSGVVTSLEYNITQSSFQISPNPNNGSFSFKSNEESDLSIYDLLGNKVYEQNAVLNKDLNLSLSQGVYFIHVKNDIGVQVQKMVIE